MRNMTGSIRIAHPDAADVATEHYPMNLHEYQAKQLFGDYAIPVPKGAVARSPDEAAWAAKTLGGERWVVKAQVHSGGRGKAGGVM
jgi:succinyl-CoA synthetase beta subunit